MVLLLIGGALIWSLWLQVQDFLKRFENIPDMLELDHLTVSGDVTFGKHVSLKVSPIEQPKPMHNTGQEVSPQGISREASWGP